MTRRPPVASSPGPLEEYAACFDDLFRARAQREGFRRYLEGLLLPAERNKTLTALANIEPSTGAQHKEAQSLQWFLSKSGWDAEAVNRRRLEILLQSAETAPHASGVLIIDETGARKDGKKTAHVGKRYLGGIGKIENGVVSVSSLWADERLYYPPANGRALHPGAPLRAGEGRTRFPPQAQDSARTYAPVTNVGRRFGVHSHSFAHTPLRGCGRGYPPGFGSPSSSLRVLACTKKVMARCGSTCFLKNSL